MKLTINIPSDLSDAITQLRGAVSPAAFVSKAVKEYVNKLQQSHIMESNSDREGKHKNTISLD